MKPVYMRTGIGLRVLSLTLCAFSARAAPAGVVEISECGTLDRENTTYHLVSDISGVTGECMVIMADRVTFDGQGHEIGGTGPVGAGIVVVGADRVNVTDVRVHDFDNGIQYIASAGGTVRQSIVDNCSKGISFISSTDMLAELNQLTESYRAILAYGSTNVTARFNRVWHPSYGVQLEFSDNSLVEYNYVTAARKYAVYLEGANDNEVRYNQAVDNRDGLYNVLSASNYYGGNIVVDSSRYGFYAAGDSSDDVTLADGAFINTALGHYEFDFYTGHGSVEGLRIIDTPIGQYNIEEPVRLTIEDTRFGSVTFLEPVSGFGTSLADQVHFDFDLVSIGYENPAFDTASRTTLYHIPRFAHPALLHDGTPCESCTPLSPLAGDEVIFEATEAGDFQVGSTRPSAETKR